MTQSGQKTPARHVTVGPEMADRRLDNFLLGELKGLPRTRVYRMIRSGEVRVNKGRAKPAYRLVPGDEVRIPPHVKADQAHASVAPGRADWILQRILYEDDSLLVLDKPSGAAVHGGSGVSLGVIELLRAARPDSRFLELVHRLDRDTSGCLLVAKKRSSLRRLHEQFRDGQVGKSYTALLHGHWKGGNRRVDLPLETTHRKNGERHVRVSNAGKSARSHFSMQQNFSDYCLAQIAIDTGRTHQIRVHADAIGHPVAGDTRYAPDRETPAGLRRLFLHAARLTIRHPDDDSEHVFETPLEAALTDVLDRLGAVAAESE